MNRRLLPRVQSSTTICASKAICGRGVQVSPNRIAQSSAPAICFQAAGDVKAPGDRPQDA